METQSLTAWEARERAGLLALETPEWREKRRIAEDPCTTAEVLARLTEEIVPVWLDDFRNLKSQGHFLVGAIAAHPNTSPNTLLDLLNLERAYYDTRRARDLAAGFMHCNYGAENELIASKMLNCAMSFCVRGICYNPVAPFICLERPDFWAQMWVGHGYLLRDRSLPYAVAAQLAQLKEPFETASNHITISGELSTQSDKRFVLPQLWQSVRTGRGYSLDEFSLDSSKTENEVSLYFDAQSPLWIERVKAAILLPLINDPISFEQWNRSPLDLLQHLAHDGNRFVRWAAQTRLADPNFVFTWRE